MRTVRALFEKIGYRQMGKPEGKQMHDKTLFDNLSNWISPEQVSKLYPISKRTVYEWKYRPRKFQIPDGLFKKFGRALMVRRDVLENWVNSRNA